MAAHEFYTSIEKNDIVGLVDDLATKAGAPFYGPVPHGTSTPVIQHNLSTLDVDVTVIRTQDKLQVGLPVERIDEDSVRLTFSAPVLGGEYRVIVSAGTGQAGFGAGGPGEEGSPPALHAASHASNGTDPLSPEAIGAAIATHSHANTYAPFTHANRHATGQPDALSPSSIGAANFVHGHSGTDISSGKVDVLRLPTGVTANHVARGDHVHPPHAGTHALEGSDPLNPSDIGAADVNHNHQNRIIPAGGAQGQVLAKASANNFEVEWVSPPGIGGPSNGPFPVVVYNSAPVIQINAAESNRFRIIMQENVQLLAPINPVDGKVIMLEIVSIGGDWMLTLEYNVPQGFQSGNDFYFTSRTLFNTVDYLQAMYVESAGVTEPGGEGGRWRTLSYIKGYGV